MTSSGELARQHLIDPEICIRCNTCEATCPIGAITHDERNYVVKFDVCNACGACIAPCPTGAIDNWRPVYLAKPYDIEEQLSWDTLPAVTQLARSDGHACSPVDLDLPGRLSDTVQIATEKAPWSADKPTINLHPPTAPAIALVVANIRLTPDSAASEVHHVVLDFGERPFPVLEGQSVGILPPDNHDSARPQALRLYSVASPRDGERPGCNDLALTVKRIRAGVDGVSHDGYCSNYICDLRVGDEVRVAGPYGATFLMPNHPQSNLLMICTGTGAAPMRAMTERRRRTRSRVDDGRLMLFFGARSPANMPYIDSLKSLPTDFIDINLAFSRLADGPKFHVQDRIRERGAELAALLGDAQTHVYICGVKGMESGVEEAFAAVCAEHGLDWGVLLSTLRATGRYHVETY